MAITHKRVKKTESLASIMQRLRRVVSAKKLKTSKQREYILELIYNSKSHLSPDEITNFIKSDNKNSSISSVYRILQFLETYGFVTSIDADKSGKRYEIAAKEHHYHIICLGCGKITEFIDDEIRNKQIEITESLNCRLVSDNLRLFVLCEKCKKDVNFLNI